MSAQTQTAPKEATMPLTAAKSIVLFSDGTGNSSAKLFKTNVWRMYEAVDLGPPAAGKRCQISYYDDGVGTSGFKPLAVLGGAFGWGLKRNVLDIYRFACRNFREGDEIYGFGFSRGAFTMRLAIALIASQGLVRSDDEAELLRRSRDAYRAFRKEVKPRKLAWPTDLVRRVRDWVTSWRERKIPKYDQKNNHCPVIRFIGVWDTVAAYGGPIVEITRAVDNWIYALSMPNYELDERVVCARHALALDDERDAFQPLLWDEVHEQQLVAEKPEREGRLQQVWFTGMHSDVGGGYPDESLSYVSLLWMMEEAEKAGLRTLETIKERFVALASSAGPLHDSRRGLAAYYRYQPRKIAGWIHPVDPTTHSLRDPLIRDRSGRAQGLLQEVRVHESVIARIASGTDRYAPLALPKEFAIFPPQAEGENVPQSDSEGGTKQPANAARPRHMTSSALRARLGEPAIVESRGAALEAVWDLVWRRRVAYFVTIGLTLLLLSMPMWADKVWAAPVLGDGRNWIGGLIRLISLFLPGFLEPWVNTYADNAFYFLVLAGAVVAVRKYSSSRELQLRDRARHVWRQAVRVGGPPCDAPTQTRLQRFRNDPRYQRFVQNVKWRILPDGVILTVTVALGVWLLAGAATQIALSFLETGTRLCAPAGPDVPELTATRIDFSTRQTCVPAGVRVVRGQRYTVAFEVVEEWRDGRNKTMPLGLEAGEMHWGFGYLCVPFRRVIKARYLQPAIEIRQPRKVFGLNFVHIYPLELAQQGDSGLVYRGSFEAKRDGELLLFANDGVWLFDLPYFYERSGEPRGNAGTACVTLQRADFATTTPSAGMSDSCAKADRRAAEAEAALSGKGQRSIRALQLPLSATGQ
jgi:uncharacterized protein (DUF2235 family)